MNNIFNVFAENPVDIVFLLLPFIFAFIFKHYKKLRSFVSRSIIQELGIFILSFFEVLILVMAIIGAVSSLMKLFISSFLLDFIEANLIYVFLFCSIVSFIYISLDYRLNIFTRCYKPKLKENYNEMSISVRNFSELARNEIWMFCGAMSFYDKEKTFLNEIAKTRRINALCIMPKDKVMINRYNEAQNNGINIRFYKKEDYDPGIRARIIDPKDNADSCAIYIIKDFNLLNNNIPVYSTININNKEHPYEMEILIKLFFIIWDISK